MFVAFVNLNSVSLCRRLYFGSYQIKKPRARIHLKSSKSHLIKSFVRSLVLVQLETTVKDIMDLQSEYFVQLEQFLVDCKHKLNINSGLDKRALEIGCGSRIISSTAIFKKFPDLRKFIISDKQHLKVTLPEDEKCIEFQHLDIETNHLQQYCNEVDYIFCINVLHHVEDKLAALRNMNRMPKKEGCLMIKYKSSSAMFTWYTETVKTTEWNSLFQEIQNCPFYEDILSGTDKEDFKKKIEAIGFEVIELKEENSYAEFRNGQEFLARLKSIFPVLIEMAPETLLQHFQEYTIKLYEYQNERTENGLLYLNMINRIILLRKH